VKARQSILHLILSLAAISGGAADDSFESQIRPLFENYCYRCHGAGKRIKGDVNLAQYKDLAAVHRDPKTWETVLRQLRDREMPPDGKPQPTAEERERLMAWVENTLDHLDQTALPKDPGRVLVHRLSRTEYNLTIRDLLGVDTHPADKFPSDGGGGGGFDNDADTLFVPPILMERFLDAAGEVLDQAKPEAVFIAQPGPSRSPKDAARVILERFATRAFRRPVEPEKLDGLLGLYESAVRKGRPFEDAVKLALKAVLVSPNFLFRVERDQPASGPYRIDDYELASRLSYFLWSSMPDQTLFDLAARNKLHEPETLEAQVQRMIRDPKSMALAEKFAGQWLGVDKLETSAQPDPNRFPTYTVELRQALSREPIEYFHYLVLENRSLLELLDSDYALLNEPLAAYYGIEGVKGEAFQRVTWTNRNRGGVLGMGAVLTLTSYPLRTSPVLRGKWVLEEILGTPPPPPPPLVKSLPKDDKPRGGLSFRQRLEKHREDPNCATCHRKMDPLGFGLENFDAIGRWRTEIAGQPVDALGEMAGGEKFSGPVELKKILLERKDLFLRNLTEKMLAYALGRGLEYYDAPTVRGIVSVLAQREFRSQTLLTEIGKSYPFQFRRNQPVAPEEKVARAGN
jgi:Protein of unknown function (DUF1592)/Protein of unknown function (DUF1588)/Protein of unknown function (DUF1587)/Protein of unknown function (DUF1595)/Protein of unknown function (DUF1585)/Cytochrome C oxidase, cbb3-type, subunit III